MRIMRIRKKLRDRIAYHALEGMLAHASHGHGYHNRPEDCGKSWHEGIAHEAYDLADAMLKAREEG
jgi:hypothetical protein